MGHPELRRPEEAANTGVAIGPNVGGPERRAACTRFHWRTASRRTQFRLAVDFTGFPDACQSVFLDPDASIRTRAAEVLGPLSNSRPACHNRGWTCSSFDGDAPDTGTFLR